MVGRDCETLVGSNSTWGRIVEWTIKLEARSTMGETTCVEVGKLHRGIQDLTAERLGLTLSESKALLAELQGEITRSQVAEYIARARVCPDCASPRRLRDRRTRSVQTLFGTVVVEAPRICLCSHALRMGAADVSFSPLSRALPDRCTAELRRLDAELGARYSFRDAARLLATFLPVSPSNHACVRNRLNRAAGSIEAAETAEATASASTVAAEQREQPEIVVMIDGAHVRAVPGHQSRHIDVTVGKVETAGRAPRRFALVPSVADKPEQAVLAALMAQGWRAQRPVIVISDGEPALPNLVSAATQAPVTHILDWWHISMRVRHVEQSLAGIHSLKPSHCAGLGYVSTEVERLRHLIWNGYSAEAHDALWAMTHLAEEAIYLNGERVGPAVRRLLVHNLELRTYLANNKGALIDYGTRYRAGLPISSSRAEGMVEEIANARMAKRRRMRWSPGGAHSVAKVRAAVLDRRLQQSLAPDQLAA